DGGDHRRLVGVALAGDEPLDGADRDALVGDRVLLAPGGEAGEKAAVGVGRIYADVPAHLLEVDGLDITGEAECLVEPTLEAEVAHAAAFEAVRLELGGAAEDAAAKIAERPAGRGAEIEGEDGGGDRRLGKAGLGW